MIENQPKSGTIIGKIIDYNHAHVNSDILKGFQSAENFRQQRPSGKISTGSIGFDWLTLGGIETGALTEIHGSAGCGKTQLCFTLCAMVQQSTSIGGLNGNAVYIDTEQKFVPSMVVQIAAARGFDTRNILANIQLARPQCYLELENNFQALSKIVERGETKLVVVDSIISHYRAEFYGFIYSLA